MALRWRKNPIQTGLASIGSGPRGSGLYENGKKFASVSPIGGDWRSELKGWYWVAGWDSDVPYKNTCNEPCDSESEAKDQAVAYVKQYI